MDIKNSQDQQQATDEQKAVAAGRSKLVLKKGGLFRRDRTTLLTVGFSLAVLGTVIGFFVWHTADSDKQGRDSAMHTDQLPKDSTLRSIGTSPDKLIYYKVDGSSGPVTVYSRSISEGDTRMSMTLPARTYIENHVIRGTQVAFVAQTSDSSKKQTAVYYSSDSGTSYKKVFVASPEGDDPLGVQITSLVFSTDGSSLAVSVLTSEERTVEGRKRMVYKNTITDISLDAGNTAKTLFSSNTAGIFLKGYDKTAKKVIYLGSSCYNCETFFLPDIFMYDMASKSQESLYTYDSKSQYMDVAVSNDFTKVFARLGKLDASQASADNPYNLFLIDVQSKQAVAVHAPEGEGPLRQAGFTAYDTPYIATDTKVIALRDGQYMTLLELAGGNDAFRIPWVLFASTNGTVGTVVTSIEGDDRSTALLSVIATKRGSATPSEVMKKGTINGDITLIGVTSN